MNRQCEMFDTRCSGERTGDRGQKTGNRGHLSVIRLPSSVFRSGFALPLVLVAMVILIILSIGAMMASYGARLEAVKAKAETEAMLAAEAGYEQAIFWMCKQTDLLGALQSGGGTGNINFGTSRCNYEVSFIDYLGARPVFKIASTGISGRPTFTRVVDVNVMQETSGWAMGSCRVPSGTTSTQAVYFANGEIIDTPLHINQLKDSPDNADIYITGHPRFLQKVEMGESRKTSGGSDKYSSVMSYFENGIDFDQPDIRITDEAAVQSKINRFRDSTNPLYRFEPNGDANVTNPRSAVQLEFFVQGGVGKVCITNNCTVRTATAGAYDYNVVPGFGGAKFQKYNIYAYHYAPDANISPPNTIPITDTYVTQSFGGYESDPGGQIFVNGNVIIGGANTVDPNMVVKGTITVVATGNIWIADSIFVDGSHDADGMPSVDNPNVLGLISQSVVKVVDPGRSKGAAAPSVNDKFLGATKKHYYQPIGIYKTGAPDTNDRYLPDPTIVEAAITVGGGGWGAENVGSRTEYSGGQDDLYARGSITEVIRGVVGIVGSDGYVKHYYADPRLMSGILPGDIWFSGKYIPAPAGWHDHSVRD